ncbi:MAG TPA: sugar phosphate nucleotidyltransferase, partial [Candidatus Limnocylindrales bacterium]
PFGVGRPLVTLGIRPTRPATEYGYVLPRQAAGLAVGGLEAYPVARFEEKPDASRASELLLETGVAWNAGMFLWQRASIRAALAEYTPLVDTLGPLLGRPRHLPAADRLAAAYEELEPISIDRAVLEPAAAAGRVLMGALDVGWSDIGGWHALLEALPGSGDSGSSGRVVPPGEWVTLLPDDLLVHSDGKRLVVTTGPSDGLVLDSHGALLVGARERAADIEALIARVAAASAGTTAEAPSMEAERT